MATIDISNAGPIERLQFKTPEGGGLIIARGRNGSGKSTAIECARSLTGGKNRVGVRDGERQAVVEGLGITLKVSKNARREGELEVEHLEGRFSLNSLVDPGIADPGAADNRRIKALVQLAGATADATAFYDLVGGAKQFNALVGPSSLETDDPVEMAGRIKRDLERESRRLEEQAKREAITAEAERTAAGDIDLTQPHDGAVLQAELSSAITAEARLLQERDTAAKVLAKADDGRKKLAEAREQIGGMDQDQARAALSAATENERNQAAHVAQIEEDLAEAKQTLNRRQAAKREAAQQLESAQQRELHLAGWQSAIEAAGDITSPEPALIDEARRASDTARRALEQGAIIRQAKSRLATADSHAEKAAQLRSQADKLRSAAAGTDDVLTSLVGATTCRLKVVAGRLCLQTKRGDHTPYAELSHGERWMVAIDLGAEALAGRDGLLLIDQEAWEGLDPINRQLVVDHLRLRGVTGFTAECDAGDLRVEEYAQ